MQHAETKDLSVSGGAAASTVFHCLPPLQFTRQIHWPPLRVEYDQQLAHARVRAWALGTTRKIS